MNGGPSQADRVRIATFKEGAFRHKLPRSHFFRAYRGNRPIDVSEATTLDEAKDAALTKGGFVHKDALLIHEVNVGRQSGALHAYTIRKRAAQYRRNPTTGLSERYEPHYADWLFSVPVDSFEPTPPFDALCDDPVGVDRTLIEERKQ